MTLYVPHRIYRYSKQNLQIFQTAQEVKEMYLKLAEALQKINEQEEKINSIKESL